MRYLKVLLLLLIIASCSGPPAEHFVVTGMALAGPVCPVETDPPDPGCAPRPVAGATIEALDRSGSTRGSATSDADGRFVLMLPSGEYTIVAVPVDGLMGTPAPVQITVTGPIDVGVLAYDTGIR
jgi:hypothetical protein